MSKVLDVLQERVASLSGKECVFGFLDNYVTQSNVLAQGRFILEPQQRESLTIGINHRKQRNRTVKLYFLKMDHVKTKSKDTFYEIEEFLEKLEMDGQLLACILNFDYQCNTRLIKRKEEDTTGVIAFEINIEIKER